MAADSIVVDSSVLIAFAKLRRVELLKLVYRDMLLPPAVHREVVTEGRKLHAHGVEQVERALDGGWLKLARLTPVELKATLHLLRSTRLHEGEAQVLAIGERRKLPVIIDDKEARSVAQTLGVSFVGTAGVLLEGFLRRHLSMTELEDTVTELTEILWLSPGVVAAILKAAREAR